MSWFSEIASKAEAMLVRLDQDAAQVLQNLDESIPTKVSPYRNEIPNTFSDDDRGPSDLIDTTKVNDDGRVGDQHVEPIETQKHADPPSQTMSDHLEPTTGIQITSITRIIPGSQQNNLNEPTTNVMHPVSDRTIDQQDKVNDYPKKFIIQTSKRNLFGASNSQQSQSDEKHSHTNHNDNKAAANLSKKSKDIRDSIKKSLREYRSQNNFSPRLTYKDENISQSSYSTHFDDQPNLIRHSSLTSDEDNYGRLVSPGQSPSFSIMLPDDTGYNASQSNDIAVRLLRESAAKRRSLSYVHEILNRLTNPDRQSVLIDQAKFQLRRVQLRGNNYARRLNYYFRANPMVKYAMFIYLIVMQLLVVYVLFFYQSGGNSPGDFSSSVDKLASSPDKMR